MDSTTACFMPPEQGLYAFPCWMQEVAMKGYCVALLVFSVLLSSHSQCGGNPDVDQSSGALLKQDEFFMLQALELARLSAQHGNHPFGALLVKDGRALARAENAVLSEGGIDRHAEINMIHNAMRDLGVKSLDGWTLYTSTEPCVMCSGAIFHAKIGTVVYGASQEYLATLIPGYKTVGIRELISLCHQQIEVRGPIMAEEAERILADYVEARNSHHPKQ
jgi:tRNA(Arg) A34 adenosine deaminase TadA